MTTTTAPTTAETTLTHGVRVRIHDAVKRFGQATALGGVSLDVEPGQFMVLLGPSGSGKSTLIRSVAGIEGLDGGSIRFDDTVVAGRGVSVAPERRDLAMVFQDYALWPHLTAVGNVSYALRRRKLSAAETTRSANDALDRVGLAHLGGRYPHELSGGEQQRVALARAVAARPRLLLFDEPLSNLDADLRERLRVEIATITRACGATAVYITHDQSEAFALADSIGVLKAGRLEQVGSPEDVYHHPISPFVARFTGVAGELDGHVLRRDNGVLVVAVGNAQVLARGDAAEGSAVTIMVRPSATTLGELDRPHSGVPAEIVDVAYRGRGYDHVVRCHGSTLTSVFDTRAWPRGTECLLALQVDGCIAYPAQTAASVTQPN